MKEGGDKSVGGSMMQRSTIEEREIEYRKMSSRRKRRKREISNMMGFSIGRGEEKGKKTIRNGVHVRRGMYEKLRSMRVETRGKKYEGWCRDMYKGYKALKRGY